MIEKVTAYKSSDGEVTGSLDTVQKHELKLIFTSASGITSDANLNNAICAIISHKDRVVDILTTGPKSKPSARAINGATKTRKPKAAVVQPENKAA